MRQNRIEMKTENLHNIFIYGAATLLLLLGGDFATFSRAAEVQGDAADSLFTLWKDAKGGERTEISNSLLKYLYAEGDLDTLVVYHRGQEEETAGVLNAMTLHLFYSNRFDEAWALGLQALGASEQCGDELLLGDSLNSLGVICQRKGLFEQAIEYMQRVYEIDRKNGDRGAMSSTMNNLASLYLGAGDPAAALEYVLPAIEYERESGDRARLAVRLALASDIWLALEKPAQALPYIEEAISIDEEDGRAVKAAVRRTQMGAVLIALGRYDEAWNAHREALSVLEKCNGGKHVSAAICLNQMGALSFKQQRWADAASYYRRALDIAEGCGSDYVKKKALQGLGKALEMEGLRSEALSVLNEYITLSENLAKEKSRMAVEDFKVQYQTAQKEMELQKENARVKRQRMLIIFFAVVILALGVMVFIFARMLRIKRRQTEILRKNDEAKTRLLALMKEVQDSGKAKEMKEIAESIETPEGEDSAPKLTSREKEIVRLCCEGRPAKEIADILHISVRTVDGHKANIFKKLKVRSVGELMKYAAEAGLLS